MIKCLNCGFKTNAYDLGVSYVRYCFRCNGLRIRKIEIKPKRIKNNSEFKAIKGLSITEQHLRNLIKRICDNAFVDIQELDLEQEFNYDKRLTYDENKERILQLLRDKGILTTDIEMELGLRDIDLELEKAEYEFKQFEQKFKQHF
jgi:hypothetical protein